MAYYVYILLCSNGSFYTGYTKDVEERARLHANGRGAKYTKMHKPQKLAYVEVFETRSAAMQREKAIKRLSHLQKQTLINAQKSHNSIKKTVSKKAVVCGMKKSSKKKLTWVEKLNDSKDLPRVEPITGKMSQRWGAGTVVIPAPLEVDEFMRKVSYGKLTTINDIRMALAKKHAATIGCPLTTGIFAWIAANAAAEKQQNGENNITPYWRTLKADGFLNDKYPGGIDIQKQLLESEGHIIASKGKRCFVVDYFKALDKL
jgi:predicted GIY-YIG superfamily endonuclease/alkylated DNA nucleotide flippase Atl1